MLSRPAVLDECCPHVPDDLGSAPATDHPPTTALRTAWRLACGVFGSPRQHSVKHYLILVCTIDGGHIRLKTEWRQSSEAPGLAGAATLPMPANGDAITMHIRCSLWQQLAWSAWRLTPQPCADQTSSTPLTGLWHIAAHTCDRPEGACLTRETFRAAILPLRSRCSWKRAST